MSTRVKRQQFDFTLGPMLHKLEHGEILQQVHIHVYQAQLALRDARRHEALARLDAAQQLIGELRSRGEQLRLRM